MRADHFELGTIKDDQLHLDIISGLCLDFHRAPECKTGICVHPKETFVYKPKEDHVVYIFEVGMPKQQAEAVKNKIQVYVKTSVTVMKRDEIANSQVGEIANSQVGGSENSQDAESENSQDGDSEDSQDGESEDSQDGESEDSQDGKSKQVIRSILIANLSREHPSFRLGVVLTTEFELSHTSERKNIYFNAFELKCRPLIHKSLAHLLANKEKELWVAKVGPSQTITFRPTAEGKRYNLLKVFSKTASKCDIQLFVDSKGTTKLLDTISVEKPSTVCKFQFDESFQLSHSSRVATVFFWGYTTAYNLSTFVKLEDLTSDPSPHTELQPPKKIVDREYHTYRALMSKKTSGENIKRVNFVPMLAPVIRPPTVAPAQSSGRRIGQ